MNRISAHLQSEQRIGLSGPLTYVIVANYRMQPVALGNPSHLGGRGVTRQDSIAADIKKFNAQDAASWGPPFGTPDWRISPAISDERAPLN
jgi:hypothetical protein